MKRVLCLVTALGLLLSMPAFAHDMHDGGVDIKVYKVFDLDDLGLSIATAPNWPQLDTGLQFDRIDPGTGGDTVAHAQYERLHRRLIDPGAVDNKRPSSYSVAILVTS